MLALLVLGSPFFPSFSFPNFHLWNFAFHSTIASQISPLKFLLNFFTYTIMFLFPTLKKKKICSYFKDTKPPIFEDINHVYYILFLCIIFSFSLNYFFLFFSLFDKRWSLQVFNNSWVCANMWRVGLVNPRVFIVISDLILVEEFLLSFLLDLFPWMGQIP